MLKPDLIKEQIRGKTFISEVIYLDETESTNSYAKCISGDGILVITDHQTSGRGRFERAWESEKGSNLTFTIKKTFDLSSQDIPLINFYFTLCVYEVIREFIDEAGANSALLQLKWPNDLMYDSKKLCGLLIESNPAKKEFILGMGINVNQEKFPAELNAVSLCDVTGTKTDLSDMLIKLVKKIDVNLPLLLGSQEQIYIKWKNANNLIGKSVIFNSSEESNKFGNVIDLQRDGGIKLAINEQECVYYSGEIKITLIGS